MSYAARRPVPALVIGHHKEVRKVVVKPPSHITKATSLVDYVRELPWGDWQRVFTLQGERDVRSCNLAGDHLKFFWKVWEKHRERMRGWGMSVRSVGKGITVTYWKGIPEEEQAMRDDKFNASSAFSPINVELPIPEGMTLYPYQKHGVIYARKVREYGGNGVLIADDMGLGKTCQSLITVNDLQLGANNKRLLIVCPASLKGNWQREVDMWLTDRLYVDGVGVAQGKRFPKDARTVIINYDILSKHEELLLAEEWGVVIMDECHYIKNQSNRTRVAVKIKAGFKILLSGTPMDSKPRELFNMIHYVDPKNWPKRSVFEVRWCGGTGSSNNGCQRSEELHKRLRQTCMVRRIKADVLTDLPAKVRQIIPVSCIGLPLAGDVESLIRNASEIAAKIEELKAKGNEDDYKNEIKSLNDSSFLMQGDMMKIRKQIGCAKVPGVSQLVGEMLDSDPERKIILFGIHVEALEAYMCNLARFNPVLISGKVKVGLRQGIVDKFQNDERCRLFIGNIQAAGVGLTLTRSSHVVMAEQDWGPSGMIQAEDRAHRIGQKDSVLVQIMVAEKSVDMTIAKMIVQKLENLQAVLDGATLPPEATARLTIQDLLKGGVV